MSRSPQQRIEQLRRELEKHNQLYYVQARQEVSDFEYDKLMSELIALETSHPEFFTTDSPSQRVGGAPIEGFETFEHTQPMYSIDNTYTEEDLRAWDERVRKTLDGEQPAYVCEPKVDGVAVSLRYENDLFVRALTRGDGRRGDDVTANVRTIRSVPLRLSDERRESKDKSGKSNASSRSGSVAPAVAAPVFAVLEVRGEIYMDNADFVKVNERQREAGKEIYANPRNFTAGTLKQLDPRIAASRKLQFVAHGFGQIDPAPDDSYYKILQQLRGIGVPTGEQTRRYATIDDVASWIQQFAQIRPTLDYNTDGMVVKVDSKAQREVLGYTSKSPRWVIAYKYPSEQMPTLLNSVTWQVGKNGTLTPVAELEPVFLAGTTVKRATLHNIEQIQRLDLYLGDTVTIEKAGEVIPQVVAVVATERDRSAEPVVAPVVCPSCGASVAKEVDGPYIRCENPACPAQLKERLRHFAARGQMNIEKLGEALIDQLVDAGKTKSFADIFRLTADDLQALPRMGTRSAQNVLASIQTSRGRSLDRLIAGLGIRHVGTTVGRLLAREFASLDEIRDADVERLAAVNGMGDVIAQSVFDFFHSDAGASIITDLKSVGIDPQGTPKVAADTSLLPLAGQSIVVTGTLAAYDRHQIEELIIALGGKFASAVSKKTSFVVAGENAGSKLEKARELGVTILTEAEFLKKVGRE
ncbi:MAG: NAD-dependent DNA ligase LigA [Burkholderiales bacterium]|nr:NAD-dependent DNA ligase LigA [Phycisphaerae bacterium]